MDSSTLFSTLHFFSLLAIILAPKAVSGANSNLFAEYIGANFNGVNFSDVPINSGVEFHFILSFAIDYTSGTTTPTPTNGEFGVFWDSDTLSADAVSAIKQNHPNVKVAVSLGGATVQSNDVYFSPTSVESWVSNAVSSLTTIIQKYNLDGIDIDYEKFANEDDTETFTECIGQLITTLKDNGVISFASIAPFDNATVQSMYEALWAKYAGVIDYVNFQFYAYSAGTTADQYVQYYDAQVSNYPDGNVLASFTTATTGQSVSADTSFSACKELKSQDKLYGIFIFSADNSLSQRFTYETDSQDLLAN